MPQVLDRFKTCFDTAKSKISTNAAIPAKKYGFTKQKYIRGDKTLNKYNFGPNVIYCVFWDHDVMRRDRYILE